MGLKCDLLVEVASPVVVMEEDVVGVEGNQRRR